MFSNLWKELILAALFGVEVTYLKEINFNQNDYKINFERGEVVSYNKHYMNYFNIKTFKYNRTCTAFNVTYNYKQEVGKSVELSNSDVRVQAYKFLSNEYRSFPIRFQLSFCAFFEKNVAGISISSVKCRNFDGCYAEKNKDYNICNFTPDESKFPPYIPNGRYMLEICGMSRSIEIWLFRAYAEVSRLLV